MQLRELSWGMCGRGFKCVTEDRWSKGTKVEYQSADGMTQVFLVSELDTARPVAFWSHSLKGPSTLNMFVTKARSLFSATRCCHRSSGQNPCIANLKQLEGAIATGAIEHPKRTKEIPNDADLIGLQAYIREKLTCPEGGEYTLGPVGEHPHCSIPWHDW